MTVFTNILDRRSVAKKARAGVIFEYVERGSDQQVTLARTSGT